MDPKIWYLTQEGENFSTSQTNYNLRSTRPGSDFKPHTGTNDPDFGEPIVLVFGSESSAFISRIFEISSILNPNPNLFGPLTRLIENCYRQGHTNGWQGERFS